MRVLQVVHALPPATYGGTELYTRDLAAALSRHGHEVAVAAPRGASRFGNRNENGDEATGPDDSPESSGPRPGDVATFDLPDPGGETAPAVGGRPLDAVDRPAVDDRFRSILADWGPDVVHCQHLKHLSAGIPEICEERGVACVATLHDFWTICHREQLYRPEGRPCSGPESVEKCADCYRRAAVGDGEVVGDGEAVEGGEAVEDGKAVESETGGIADGGVGDVSVGDGSAREAVARRDDALRRALSATDRLVAPSAFLRETFAAFGTPAEAIDQCRNGVRVERFEDTGFDPAGALRVGYAGRITERKGVHLLADAAGRVEGVDLHVFGRFDPESDDYHARLAESAGDRATFHGWYADRATPYREVDVLVLPSVWYENSPLVIQEANAAGVPVVTADAGGMAELVRDGEDGLTFEVGDSDSLADALGRLAESPGLVADLREGVTEPKRLRDHAVEIADLYAECAGGN